VLGVAVWAPPEQQRTHPKKKDVLKLAWETKHDFFGVRSLRKFAGRVIKKYRLNYPQPTWILAYCVIDDELRNKKLGEFLISPVLEWMDFNGQDCIAWGCSEEPMNFLMKSGFQVKDRFETPEKVSVWVMERKHKKIVQ